MAAGRSPSFLTFGRFPAPPFWNTVAIDRSQNASAVFNLATIAQGGAANAAGWLNRWGAPQGAGAETAAVFDGINCNVHGANVYRALHFWLPIRHFGAAPGQQYVPPPMDEYFTFDVVMGVAAGAPGSAACGSWLLQSDGTDVSGTINSVGARGLGFTCNGGTFAFVTANGGGIAIRALAAALPNGRLFRGTIVIRNATIGADASASAYINGVLVAQDTLFNWGIPAPGPVGYAAGRFAYVPVVSGDTSALNCGGLSLTAGAIGAA